jgi:hypothetical protein
LAYIIKSFPISDDEWYPITPPCAVMGWSIRNSSSQYEVLIRTDEEDEGTEDNIPAGSWELVSLSSYRFNNTEPIFWAKSTNGPITLKGRFIS